MLFSQLSIVLNDPMSCCRTVVLRVNSAGIIIITEKPKGIGPTWQVILDANHFSHIGEMSARVHSASYIARCSYCVRRTSVVFNASRSPGLVIYRPDHLVHRAELIHCRRGASYKAFNKYSSYSLVTMASSDDKSIYRHQLDCAIRAVRLASKLCKVATVIVEYS